MVRSVFARVAAFVKWLLAPEKLDCPLEHGLDRTRPYYGPIYGRKNTFLAWLLSWEELPVEGPAEASSSTRPTFIAYLLSRESLPQTAISGAQRARSSKELPAEGCRLKAEGKENTYGLRPTAYSLPDPIEAEDPKPEPPTSKVKH